MHPEENPLGAFTFILMGTDRVARAQLVDRVY